eukprot:1075648-Amphidinium_carterae.1
MLLPGVLVSIDEYMYDSETLTSWRAIYFQRVRACREIEGAYVCAASPCHHRGNQVGVTAP